jgi:hypothetical protein
MAIQLFSYSGSSSVGVVGGALAGGKKNLSVPGERKGVCGVLYITMPTVPAMASYVTGCSPESFAPAAYTAIGQ